DMLVRRGRASRVALRLMCKLLEKQGYAPKLLVTDKLRPYASAFRRVKLTCRHSRGVRKTNWRRNRIRGCADRSASCDGSNPAAPPSASLACKPPSTTPSTFNAISSRDRHCGSFEPRRQRDGQMPSPQRETRPALTPSRCRSCGEKGRAGYRSSG